MAPCRCGVLGGPRPRRLPSHRLSSRHRGGPPVTGRQPDPLVHAAVRLLDAVEADLFPTAEDITEQGTPRPLLDALVVALVPPMVAAVSGRRWPRAVSGAAGDGQTGDGDAGAVGGGADRRQPL